MFSRTSRRIVPLALVSNLLLSSFSLFAAPRQQDQQPKQPSTQAAKVASTAVPTPSPSPSPSPSSGPSPAHALAVNEDPAMIGKRNVNTGVISKMSMSLEKEVAMGRQLAAEVDRQSKFVDDPVITEYVNRVAQNLVLHSDAKIPFNVKVIDSDEVNAFALPGGFFYVNKGLILAADNEAELAGVMAHEIAHVCARHAMENERKMEVIDYGMMATMFEKLEAKNKKKPGTLAKMFQDHPAPADRRASALALAARFPEREEYVISSSEFQRVKNRLLRLSNARASSSGAIAGADDGTPGRPTLKRRQPTPDDSTTTPDSTAKPDSTKPAPPSLKREPQPQATPTPQP